MPGKKHEPDKATKERCLARRRDFTAKLFMREAAFWDWVRHERLCWQHPVDAPRQLPPPPSPGADRALPQEIAALHASRPDFFLFMRDAWYVNIDYMVLALVPEAELISEADPSGSSWQRFIAGCVLADPPFTELIEFAAYDEPAPPTGGSSSGGAEAESIEEDELSPWGNYPLYMGDERALLVDWQDPDEVRKVEDWRYHAAHGELEASIRERYGINDPGLSDLFDAALNPVLDRDNDQYIAAIPSRPGISFGDLTTEDDLLETFRAFREREVRGPGRPGRDRLTALQCAILHLDFGESEVDLARRFNWQLSEGNYPDTFRSVTARDYINDGRELRETALRTLGQSDFSAPSSVTAAEPGAATDDEA